MTGGDISTATTDPLPLRGLIALLAGGAREPTSEEDIEQARAELDEALAALRRARAGWSSPHTLDAEALRQALDLAERQLDAARMRLQRALQRHR